MANADRDDREAHDEHRADAPPGARARLAGEREEADRQAGQRQQAEHRDDEDPELHAGLLAQVDGDAVVRQRGLAERPGRRGARARRGDEQQRRRAQAPRRDRRDPERPADHRRQQRAARVRQEDRQQDEAERRVGERVERLVAGAPRAEPQQPRHGERGHEADAVPVAERLRQPGVDLVGVQRGGEDLRQDGIRADDDAGQRDRAEHRAPAMRDGMCERRRRREDRQVGERPVGFEPRVRRVRGPRDRQRGERRERGHERDRPDAPEPLAAG